MNNIDQLIRRANRIGSFFAAMPDRNEGMAGIADHIQKFWEPRMRTSLLSFLERQPDGQSDTVVLSQIVLDAINQNKSSLQPSTVQR